MAISIGTTASLHEIVDIPLLGFGVFEINLPGAAAGRDCPR